MSQIIRDITEITRCGSQYRSENLAPLGLKACHASYLTEICACPGISQDRLAQRICINKSNVARQIAVLEEGAFVTRVPAQEDKRVMRLYPTQKTLELLPQITALLDAWEARLSQDFTPQELELLADLLARMKAKAADWMEAN